MPIFNLNSGLSAGDILTSASIVVSVIALLAAWASQRALQRREQADKVRSAASRTLTRLERWLELHLWLFDYVQPDFVETDEKLASGADILAARDYLWKAINTARTEIKRHVMDEEIETAYVDLYAYQPATYELFVNTMNKLRRAEEDLFDKYLAATQEDVMAFESRGEDYLSSMLGNKLRATNYSFRERLRVETNETLRPIYTFLRGIITEPDQFVLRRPTASVPNIEPFAARAPRAQPALAPTTIQSHADHAETSAPGNDLPPRNVLRARRMCPFCGSTDTMADGRLGVRCNRCGSLLAATQDSES